MGDGKLLEDQHDHHHEQHDDHHYRPYYHRHSVIMIDIMINIIVKHVP